MSQEYSQKEIEDTWDNVWHFTVSDTKQIFVNKLFKAGYESFLPYIKIHSFSTFLEVGAGTGRYGLAFAKDFPNTKFTLTDPTQGSVDYMSKLLNSLQLSNVDIQIADATKLDFSDDSFDVVFADCVIQHISDYRKAIDEMVRVLKPGGMLFISSVNPYNPGHSIYKLILKLKRVEYVYGYERCFSRKELNKEFKKQKLNKIVIDGFYPEYGVLRHKKKNIWIARLGIIHRHITLLLDGLTLGRFSKIFGFEVFAVGVKSHE